MEDNNEGVEGNNFIGQMLHEALEENPRMAIQMLMAALKLPTLVKYIEEHKDELDKTISIDMKAGEALFLFSACLSAVGQMGHNLESQSAGQLHTHALRDYASAGMVVAKLVHRIGYPEESAISDMAGAIATMDGAFEKITEIREKVKSGEMSVNDMDDMIGREFR